MKDRVKTIIAYGLPAIIVLVIDCIILGVQGIWPLGAETIEYYDMGQQLASEYLQVYDELHGAKSVVFDWYTCLSRGIPGGTYISVFNLLYYLVPRDMILESFSISFIIKNMCMALTMGIFLRSEIKECPEFVRVMLSVGYGLCGYGLMHYTMISWLDIAVLVPLVMMYTQRLLSKGEIAGYIISVALMLLVNFYIPVMCLLFVFLMTGIYVISEWIQKREPSDEYKTPSGSPYILRLGIATLAALLLSAWVWIPKVFDAAGSMRFNNEVESGIVAQYAKILAHVRPDYSTRWWCLLGISFSASIVILGITKDLKNKNLKRPFFVSGALLITLLQLVFENVNLIWHFGSYVNYPARDGFLMYLVFASAAAYYAKDIWENFEENNIPVIVPMGGILVTLLAVSAILYWYNINPGMSVYTVFRVSVLCAMAAFVVYMLLILFKSGKYAKLSIFILCAELIVYGVLLVGKPTYITGYSEEPEQDGEYIRICRQLVELLDIPSSRLDRIKNPDATLNTNYGNMLERATFTGWPSSLSNDVVQSAYMVGNSTQYTRMLDSGGNAFTDALFHTTQIISLNLQDGTLYENQGMADVVFNHRTGEIRQYGLYNCRYVLPFGTVVNDESSLNLISAARDDFDFTNAVYRAIGSDDSDIAEKVEISDIDVASVKITGRKLLYIRSQCEDAEYANVQVFINGRAAEVPTIQKPDNTWYPEHFNNSTLYLGSFEDETALVTINRNNSIDAPHLEFTLYTIDLDKLSDICGEYAGRSSEMIFTAGTRSLDITVNGQAGEYLLLPMEYSNDWTAYNNGDAVGCNHVNGLFMALPLVDGVNNIHMAYFPRTMKLGIIISAAALIILLALCGLEMCDRKYRIGIWGKRVGNLLKLEDKTKRLVVLLYSAAWSVVVIFVYVLPVAYGVWYYIISFWG